MKNWFKRVWSRIQFPDRTAPLAFLGVMLAAYGIYVPLTGFYWDDWPVVYLARTHGNFWVYYQSDRPFMAVPEILGTFLFHTNPLAWQIGAFLLRWAVVVCLWACLRLVWPKARWQATATALLFSVYPLFFQQPLAITYKSHFFVFLFYLLSVACMLLAVRKPKWRYPLTILAVLTGAVHLLIMEYFWGLELLRPVLLWIVLAEEGEPWKVRLKRLLPRWLPYLVLFGGVLVWRFFFLRLQHDRNAPTALIGLVRSPLATLQSLLQAVSRDLLNIFVSTWGRVVDPLSIDVSSIVSLVSWGLVILMTLLVGLYLLRSRAYDPADSSTGWSRQALLVGGLAVLFGMTPVWATNRQELVGMYSDRLAIPAMLGASLFLVGLISWIAARGPARILLVALLVGLSSGYFFRAEDDYRKDWNAQKAFYWQLYWRAPGLKPGTSILTEKGVFQFTAQYALATALDSLYPVPAGTTQLPYWTFELDNLDEGGADAASLKRGVTLDDTVRNLSFHQSSLDSLVVFFERTKPHCLWVVTPLDTHNPYLGPNTEANRALTNLGQILPQPTAANYPDPATFGAEPAHTWCYFFEKADLARQLKDWQTVTSLGDQALAKGYGPEYSSEWVPFIEGYIHEQNWDRAVDLSKASYQDNPKLATLLCDAWGRALDGQTLSADAQAQVQQIRSVLACGQ